MFVKTQFLQDTFHTARENMSFDEYLIDQCLLHKDTRFVRVYEWQQPGVTYPEHRSLPVELHHLDHSPRVSGGGIVFHGKGDVVFSIISRLDDDLFPKKFKDKIDWISTFFRQCLIDSGFQVMRSHDEDRPQDINYCVTYSNPYEWIYRGNKVMGLAQRRYKNVFCSQGVIYCQSNYEQFPLISDHILPYLTEGLQGKIKAEALIHNILSLGKRCFGVY